MAREPGTPTFEDEPEHPQGNGRRRKRGPTVRKPIKGYLKYEVLDASGNVLPDARVKPLGVERDVQRIVDMTLTGQLDGKYVPFELPVAKSDHESAPADE